MKSVLTAWLLATLLTTAVDANAQTQPAAIPASATDSTELSAYAGVYTFVSGSPVQKFTVSVKKGDLYGEADGFGEYKLLKQPIADTYRSTSSYGSIITFVRDAATKAIAGLTLAAQGMELSAKRNNP